VEDDDAEYHLIKMAIDEIGWPIRVFRAKDGEQALWFLEKSHGHEVSPRPDLILLNLNLPRGMVSMFSRICRALSLCGRSQ